jgi:hypothetical protein
VVEATLRPNRGGLTTPKGQMIFIYFYFLDLAIGGGWTTPSHQLEWSSHPQWGGKLLLIFIFYYEIIFFLLFLVSGTSVLLVTLAFLKTNPSHELDIL